MQQKGHYVRAAKSYELHEVRAYKFSISITIFRKKQNQENLSINEKRSKQDLERQPLTCPSLP